MPSAKRLVMIPAKKNALFCYFIVRQIMDPSIGSRVISVVLIIIIIIIIIIS